MKKVTLTKYIFNDTIDGITFVGDITYDEKGDLVDLTLEIDVERIKDKVEDLFKIKDIILSKILEKPEHYEQTIKEILSKNSK